MNSTLIGILHLLPVKKRNPYVKISKNIYILPVKTQNPCVKKSLKVPMKNSDRTWKLAKKCAWKRFFVREKTQKKAKKKFHAHFWFSRRKKKTGGIKVWGGWGTYFFFGGRASAGPQRRKLCGDKMTYGLTLSYAMFQQKWRCWKKFSNNNGQIDPMWGPKLERSFWDILKKLNCPLPKQLLPPPPP